MNTSVKRLLSLSVAFVIALSAAACSSASKTGAETSAASADSTTAEETTSYLDTLGEHDFDGRTFTVLCQHSTERPNMPEDTETGDVFLDAVYRRDIAVEERYHIDIVYANDENRSLIYGKLMKSVAAQEDEYDLVLTSLADGFNRLAPGGYLYDMRAIDTLSLDSEWWSSSMNEEMTYAGKQFVAAGPISLSYLYSAACMVFNSTLAADYNITSGQLYAAVNDGSWTLDMLKTLFTGVYTDLNNNSKCDINDRYGLASDDLTGNELYVGAGLEMAGFNSEGGIDLNMDSEVSFNLLDKLHDMLKCDDNLLTEELGNDPTGLSYKISLFRNGQVLFSEICSALAIGYLRSMENDYGMLPTPKADEKQSRYYSLYNAWMPGGVGVPVTCGDPSAVGTIIEALDYISYADVQPKLYEVTLKEKVARDENSKQMLDIIYESMKVDLNGVFNFGDTSTALRSYAVGRSANFASVYQAKLKSALAAVDKLLEQYGTATSK